MFRVRIAIFVTAPANKLRGSTSLSTNIKQNSPKHDVCEEAGLQVKSTPAQSFAIHCEVFGDPEDRIWQTTALSSTKFLIKATGCMTYSNHEVHEFTTAEKSGNTRGQNKITTKSILNSCYSFTGI